MRIVWVSRFHPARDGEPDAAIEHRWLLEAVAEHDVHVVSGALPPGEVRLPVGPGTISAEGVNWLWLRFPRTFVGRLAQAAWPGAPVEVRATRRRTRGLAGVLHWRLEREPADLVVVTAAELAPVARASAIPAVLMLPGRLARASQARALDPAAGPLSRLRWRLDARRADRWERRWGSRVAGVACADPVHRESLIAPGRDVALLMPGDDGAVNGWLERLVGRAGLELSPAVERPRSSAVGRPPPASPPATVVVCTSDRPQLLESSLPSLQAAVARAPDTELLVVEQGSPVVGDVLARLGIDGTVVHDAGVGAARARNLGAREAAGEVLLFTDDDCAVPPTWVVDHVARMAQADVVASFGAVEGITRFEMAGDDPVAWPARHHAGSPPWAIGHSSNMAVRRTAFLEAGGFDERFGPGAPGGMICEDADVIVRLLRSGGAIGSGVGAPVRHLEWRSQAQDNRNLRAYERGAGAWIGKLMREDRRAAAPYLRERVELAGHRVRESPGIRRAPMAVLTSIGAFVNGLRFGLRLRPWPSPAAGRRPAHTLSPRRPQATDP